MYSNRRKIAQVIPSMNIGGRERVVLDIIHNLDRRWLDVHVVCLGGKGGLYRQFSKLGVPLYFLGKPPGFRLKLFHSLWRHFRDNRYDVVHSHNPGAFIYTAVSAKAAGVGCIINSEHGYGQQISFRKKLAESVLMNRINATLAVSEDLRQILSRPSWVKDDKVVRLYNGIDVAVYMPPHNRSGVRKKLGLVDGDILIGTVGRLAEVKDQGTLINAYGLLRKSDENIRLIIVGDGERYDTLLSLARDLGDAGKGITFTGERQDIPDLLSAMDIFVLPSLNEGISITLLEAMAAKLPVIATSVGGNVEVVDNRVSGLLVPSKSPEALADALLHLIQNEPERIRLGNRARKRVMDQFDMKRMINDLETIYTSNCSSTGN